MSEIGLERTSIDAIVRQFEPAGVSEHMGVGLDVESGLDGSAFGISAYVHISAETPVMPGISGSAMLRKPHFTAVLAKLQ